jgi:Mrp family chromosome partitioning ATPase
MVGRGLTRGLRADALPGLREALETGKLAIRQRPDGLSVLTAGDSTASDAAKVSATGVRRLLAEARKHFDTILVDSGPILGSVEAAVVAREVDGVVFVITRGQDPDAVDRSLRHLDSIGANLLGAVFNRANVTDFYRSFQGSSLRPDATGARKPAAAPTGFDTPTLFGPIVSSVASCLPAGAASSRRRPG